MISLRALCGQIRAALSMTGGALLVSGNDWHLHASGAIVFFSAALWSYMAHDGSPLIQGIPQMKLSDFLGLVSTVLSHPETVVPAAVAPQAEAIAQTIATAGASIEAQAASAALPLVDHEATTVLDHNHLGQFAPLLVTIFDTFASAWVTNKNAPPPAA